MTMPFAQIFAHLGQSFLNEKNEKVSTLSTSQNQVRHYNH